MWVFCSNQVLLFYGYGTFAIIAVYSLACSIVECAAGECSVGGFVHVEHIACQIAEAAVFKICATSGHIEQYIFAAVSEFTVNIAVVRIICFHAAVRAVVNNAVL